jgi:hypothetical protein
MDDSPIQTALCVIGHPIGGNPAQFVASRALAALGLDWQFVSFDVAPSQIEKAIRGVDSLGFCGAMIASPYQTKVAEILSFPRGETNDKQSEAPLEVSSEPVEDSTWFDCLIRNQENQLVAYNLHAEAVQSLIEAHATRIGRAFGSCLILSDSQKLSDFVRPLKQVLPASAFCSVGDALTPWPSQPSPTETPADPANPVEPTSITASRSLSDEPWLILWGLDAKPRKKVSSKAQPVVPSPARVTELLTQLHPDSLLVDLTGTVNSWLESLPTENEQPISLVTTVDLELLRLATAIKRWTGKQPNMDLMREAIEEYLEV